MKDPSEQTKEPGAAESDLAAYETALANSTIGPLQPLLGPIRLSDYSAQWPLSFLEEARRIRRALGDHLIRIEHVGSTSVPGLAAKPIIDIALEVRDSSVEADYLPAMEMAGYVLRIREPGWYEHRLFKSTYVDANVHTFSAGCPEVARMVLFRDWLRVDERDRRLYEEAKQHLARLPWKYTQQYADAKSEIVEAILGRAAAGYKAAKESLP